MRSSNPVVRRALQAVNAARVACGFQPLDDIPRGVKGDARSCPVARALSDIAPGVRVGAGYTSDGFSPGQQLRLAAAWNALSNGEFSSQIKNPTEISDFVMEFDRGSLPEYQEGPRY